MRLSTKLPKFNKKGTRTHVMARVYRVDAGRHVLGLIKGVDTRNWLKSAINVRGNCASPLKAASRGAG